MIRRILLAASLLPLSALGASMAGCTEEVHLEDEGDLDVDSAPLAWVSPTKSSVITQGQVVQLSVRANDPSVDYVRFFVDGKSVESCDVRKGPDECNVDRLFRAATKFAASGNHRLEAKATYDGAEHVVGLNVRVRAASKDGGLVDDEVDGGDGGTTGPGRSLPEPGIERGFLDPDKPLHNVFGGVSWSIVKQRVEVVDPPSGSIAAVAACMARYGTSIIKHGDEHGVSRAAMVATAITESNCTNPVGSSDGLSSGPMQVTGYTCRKLVPGFASDADCKTKMYQDPDFSFYVAALVMGEDYSRRQAENDPPKIAATYNAGSVRQSSANRWHMLVTGNHIDRFVGAYNAYRAWEIQKIGDKAQLLAQIANDPESHFDGEHVASVTDLPRASTEGQVYFVGRWPARDGEFVTYRRGTWQKN